MKKTTQATPAAAPRSDAVPAAGKPRRPRRMAREQGDAPPAAKPAPTARGPSKIEQVVALLSRTEGATLAELIAATGWLPHTTRAALTGLRKKGHSIAKTSRDGATCYRIEVAA